MPVLKVKTTNGWVAVGGGTTGSSGSGTGGSSYTLPVASAATLGGIKVGGTLSITNEGVANVNTETIATKKYVDDTLGEIESLLGGI